MKIKMITSFLEKNSMKIFNKLKINLLLNYIITTLQENFLGYSDFFKNSENILEAVKFL